MKCEKLDIWKDAVSLSIGVYKNTFQLRDFGFRDQLTRSCLSIPSNIAEGMERESIKENIRFLDISRSSAAEFITQVHIGIGAHFIDSELGDKWRLEAQSIMKRTTKLIQYFRNKI
ncbi:MAG: four helix bundle protein [Bacteroidales bacterium]|jgi:four helix bundle protein|nr:four helix bundle protein [Bacteroidales bacterium]